MDSKLSNLEQYKMLREEIMQNIRELSRIEMAAAIGVAALYAWLLLHRQDIPSCAIWYVSPLIVFVCGCRCIFLYVHTKFIAEYLRRIEEVAFGDDTYLPGWERYVSQRGSHLRTSTRATIAVWAFAFCASIVISYLLS